MWTRNCHVIFDRDRSSGRVVTMDIPDKYSHADLSDSTLYSASTLHLYGLTYDYDSYRSTDPHLCAQYATLLYWALYDRKISTPGYSPSSHTWTNVVVMADAYLLEKKRMRSDASRPRDLYDIAGGTHAKYAAMDGIIVSSMYKSCLLHSSTSSDYVLR